LTEQHGRVINAYIRAVRPATHPVVDMAAMRLTMFLVGALAASQALAACAQTSATAPAASTDAADQKGRWLTASGNLEVEIGPCGEALCGTVVRVVANKSMAAPNATMTPVDAQPALGMMILADFRPTGDGEWKGRIYNRENGKTYSCVMALLARDQLKIRPYIILPIFGQTQIWRRVSAPAG
jgi:uncharacterized protein (DUF2147 family)